jgi:hypothetical protein
MPSFQGRITYMGQMKLTANTTPPRYPSLNSPSAAAMQGAVVCQKPKYILLFA